MSGECIEKDVSKGFHLIETAAFNGNVEALTSLAQLIENGEGTEKNIHMALSLYEASASNGEVNAILRLASLLENGSEEVAQDKERAVILLQEICHQSEEAKEMLKRLEKN